MKDWTGNSRSAHATLGARNYALEERQEHDYYATEPKAVELLLKNETFSPAIWECACGGGHISRVLEAAGYNVRSTDLYYSGYGEQTPLDFLKADVSDFDGDIITNPPYKFAKEFVEKAIETVGEGHKVAMFLKVQFLESQGRFELFQKYPPKVVYVSVKRLHCAKNGDFETAMKNNAVCYSWFVWEKGHNAPPIIRWLI